MGTPSFMSPEQARGDKVDARADLWSLGVVLYRLSTGQQPFSGADVFATIFAINSQQPKTPAELSSEVPVALSEQIMKLLEKDPKRRPATAQQVVDALRRLKNDGTQISGEQKPLAPATTQVQLAAAAPGRRHPPAIAEDRNQLGRRLGRIAAARGGQLVGRDVRAAQGVQRAWWLPFRGAPDGKTLAACQYVDGKLVDLASGKITAFEGFFSVYQVAFSPDDTLLAVGGRDAKVIIGARLWDVATGKVIHQFKTGEVRAVAFSPNGKTFATGESDYDKGHKTRLWDTATGAERQTLPTGLVTSLAFSPDGKTLAVGLNEATKGVALWDVSSGKKTWSVLESEGSSPYISAFSPDGKRLAAADVYGAIRLIDAGDGQSVDQPAGHAGGVTSLGVSADGRIIVSGGVDRTVRVWDVASGRFRRAHSDNKEPTWCVSLSPDGRNVAGATSKGEVKLWDTTSGDQVGSLSSHKSNSALYSLAFSPDGKVLAAGGYETPVRLWDCVVPRELPPFPPQKGYSYDVAYTSNGKMLLTNQDETVHVWDVEARKELHSAKAWYPRFPWRSLAVSPDGKLAAFRSSKAAGLTLLELATGKVRRTWPKADPMAVTFSNDSQTVITAGEDGTLTFWDVKQPWDRSQPTKTLRVAPPQASHAAIYQIAATADGRHLVTLNGNGTIYVLRLERTK